MFMFPYSGDFPEPIRSFIENVLPYIIIAFVAAIAITVTVLLIKRAKRNKLMRSKQTLYIDETDQNKKSL